MRASRPRDNYKKLTKILKKRIWSLEEINYIKENWKTQDDETLSKNLQRTLRATKSKRESLGLFRKECGKSHNINEIIEIFDKKGYVLLSNKYRNNHQKLEYICLKHKEKGVQKISLSSIIHKGCGCYYCGLEKSANAKKHSDDYYINWCKDNDFIYVDRIIKNHQTHIGFYCKKHIKNGIQYKSITNIEKGTKCIFCNNFKTESSVGDILDKNNIKYIRQKRFKNCRYKYTLPFDYYIPEYKIAIEYDGEQHYKPIRFNGSNNDLAEFQFKETQKRDEIKTNFCNSNNIFLIRIPYYKKDNMEQFILEKLSERIAFYN